MLVSKTYSEIIDHDCLPSIKVFSIGEEAISAMSSVFDLYEGCINYIALSDKLPHQKPIFKCRLKTMTLL